MAMTARALASFSSSASATPRSARLGAAPAAVAAAHREPARRLVAEFDPAVPLASAVTPPSGWYTDPDFLRLELDRVFLRGWQAVGTHDRSVSHHGTIDPSIIPSPFEFPSCSS
jgi:choline monooxygenase